MRRIAIVGLVLGGFLLVLPVGLKAIGFDAGPNIALNDALGQFWSLKTQPDAAGNQAPVVATQGIRSTSTESGGSITLGGTFQSILASNTARLGCTVQNTGTAVLYVFFGATGSATTANAFQVAAGGSIACQNGGVVLTDNVAATTAASGGTYVVNSQ